MNQGTSKSIIWQRQDGLYSSAVSSEVSNFREFTWFTTGFSTAEEAERFIPEGVEEPEIIVADEGELEVIRPAVNCSCHALTPEQAKDGVPYGTNDLDHLTDNERAVLKDFHRDEYMDDGLETPLNYDWAVSEGVQVSAGVSARSASGIISSLVKKGYFTAQENPGEDNFIIFHESARIVNRLLNADTEKGQ